MKKFRFVTVLLALAVSLCACSGCSEVIKDYTQLEFADYMTVDRSDYFGNTVRVPVPPKEVTEADVDAYIQDMLLKTSIQGECYPEKPITAGTLKEGDVANLWYRMVYKGEEVAGTCNYEAEAPEELLLLPEETGLIAEKLLGVSIAEGQYYFRKNEGEVSLDSTVYISCTPRKESGPYSLPVGDLVRMELATLPEALADYIAVDGEGAPRKAGDEFRIMWEDQIFEITLLFAVEECALVIPATLPKDFTDKESFAYLNGAQVEYHVVVESFYPLELFAFDKQFVCNNMGADPKDPEDVIIKTARAVLKERIKNTWQTTYEDLLYERLWGIIYEKVQPKIRAYPEELIEAHKIAAMEELQRLFDHYKANFSNFPYTSVEEYGKAYYGTEKDLNAYLDEMFRKTVALKMIEAYIAVQEGLLPTEEDMDEAYPDFIEKMIAEKESQGWVVTKEDLESEIGIDELRAEMKGILYSEAVWAFLQKNTQVEDSSK